MAENEKHERKPLIKSGATRSFTPQDSDERQMSLQTRHAEELKERLKEAQERLEAAQTEKAAAKEAKE